ncbi:GntR family transcriptional regulator [Rhizobiaceae bacterium n13]|uniref:GntR family transcriptional regulator n=1 Tax=Ferirhizobium litorale TaxID=2927786 RepID=A0AAE3QF42_9HYPH|nr:GntR family transcriptional regulator [Fererhizobium litorale]MDI7862651.1 GntR family transcriptional regulator [Fererhizobium litorale]MDI7923866.1 GntR family transcriptional regulator [Fererhizobium litorale]
MSVQDTQAIETAGDMAFRLIRQDIIAGTLAPRQKLKLDDLRDRYCVSVSTLRETLSRLASENMVVAEGQRGFQVAPVSVKELRDLGELRLLLESHALSLSFCVGDLEWEARVVAARHKLAAIEQQLLAGDIDRTPEWVRYDWGFHQALASACGSAVLMSTLATIFDRFLRYHLVARSFRGKPVADDHRQLFELAMNRDIEGARNMLRHHVESGIDHVISTGRIG